MGMKPRSAPETSSEPASEVTDTAALKRLAHRLDNPVRQVDNGSLHAGAPMYYYCRLCGHLAATMSEGHWGSPPKHCKECTELIEVTNLTPTSLLELVKDYRKEQTT